MSQLFNQLVDIEGKDYPILYEYTDDQYEDNNPNYIGELALSRIEFIRQLKPDNIVKVEVVDMWQDDHEPCLAVDIMFDTGDILSVAAPWITQEFVSCFYRPDDKCKAEIIEYLQDQLTF